jgi:hypothetical protein
LGNPKSRSPPGLRDPRLYPRPQPGHGAVKCMLWRKGSHLSLTCGRLSGCARPPHREPSRSLQRGHLYGGNRLSRLGIASGRGGRPPRHEPKQEKRG